MTNFYHTNYRIIASPKKTAIAPLSTTKITIASPQKLTSDRPFNTKNHDRLSQKNKQRSPLQHLKTMIASPQKSNSDRPFKKQKHDRT